jgi:hypothetical protein
LIKQYSETVKISYLLHFTRVSNLSSIMKYGLYPIERVHEIGANPEINDHERWDGHRDSTSLSISFPNYKMFYKYRMENQEIDWTVLVLDPSILWTKKCAFSKHNAADNRIRSQSVDDLLTLQAFSGMFEPIDGHPSREVQRLKSCDPTDGQAEIMVFDVIEPNFINGVIFSQNSIRDAQIVNLGAVATAIHPMGRGFFASRSYVR